MTDKSLRGEIRQLFAIVDHRADDVHSIGVSDGDLPQGEGRRWYLFLVPHSRVGL